MATVNEKEELGVSDLIDQIKQITAKQKSQSLSDQIRVQKALLNDPDYEVSVYDRNKGKVGTRNVHSEAVNFIADTSSAITGIPRKEALENAEKYKFTNKDATFFLNMNKDFTETYLLTGRKLNIVQTEDSEASIFYRPVEAREKIVPGKNGSKPTVISGYQKVIVRSKAPKYMKKD